MTEQKECIVCYEPFGENEKLLSCNHIVHLDCIQKSADAMQDIRIIDGYPPIKECVCPVCKKPVKGIKPKDPEINNNEELLTLLYFTNEELNEAVNNWYNDFSLNDSIPLSLYFWEILCQIYPENDNIFLLNISHIIEREFLENNN